MPPKGSKKGSKRKFEADVSFAQTDKVLNLPYGPQLLLQQECDSKYEFKSSPLQLGI